jgi:hypothetical protein
MSRWRGTHGAESRESSKDFRGKKWIDSEVVGCKFEDARHGKRLRQLLEKLSSSVGLATPWACQDWANSKAAYRSLGNDRISEANILAGHFGDLLPSQRCLLCRAAELQGRINNHAILCRLAEMASQRR